MDSKCKTNFATPASSAEDKRQIARLELSQLLAHPMQDQFADDCTPAEEAMFLNDLKAGQRTPIEVLPADADGKHVIADGHRRVAALRQLGKTHANAIVREDLANASVPQIEIAFLTANLHRRHLSPLQKMRSARRMAELEIGDSKNSGVRRGKVKSKIASLLGLSTRMINRYLLATDAPVEVQRAVDDGKLTLIEAGRIALLPTSSQHRFAELLRTGITRSELKRHLRDAGIARGTHANHVHVNDALASFVRTLSRGINDLDGRIPTLTPRSIAVHLPELDKAAGIIIELLDRAGTASPDSIEESSIATSSDSVVKDETETSDTMSQPKSKRRK